MSIQSDEISKIIRDQIGSFAVDVDVAEVGTVISLGDGIARVHGCERAMAGEMLEFPHGVFGIALNLEEDSVGAVLLGEYRAIKEGDPVKRTGRIISVPVGDEMLGRVVNALGSRSTARARSSPSSSRRSSASPRASSIGSRCASRCRPASRRSTAMVPIGRGQRELIIGDRQTGKTAVALDTILNQKDTGVICIYNAIGQKQSTVAQVVRTLEEADAMRYCIIVAATASDPAPMLYISPYSATHDGRVLPRQRPARAADLRRPLEARAGVSRDLAAAAPSARPRGLPRRRLLPALAPAGARGEAERRQLAAAR